MSISRAEGLKEKHLSQYQSVHHHCYMECSGLGTNCMQRYRPAANRYSYGMEDAYLPQALLNFVVNWRNPKSMVQKMALETTSGESTSLGKRQHRLLEVGRTARDRGGTSLAVAVLVLTWYSGDFGFASRSEQRLYCPRCLGFSSSLQVKARIVP